MWGFYSKEDIAIPPRIYTDGKTQEDTIKEVLDLFDSNESNSNKHHIVVLEGKPASGKSAICVHIAKALGRGIIAVPVKHLQKQYEDDYSDNRYISLNGNRCSIKQIKGRNNFLCKKHGIPASNRDLPCTKRLTKKQRRWDIASTCPDWNPIYPTQMSDDTVAYSSIKGTKYYHDRGNGCEYCSQFRAYFDSDVIVMNSAKYLLETYMGRKPKVDIEIIDEFDGWLDQLSLQESIGERTISRLAEYKVKLKASFERVLEGKDNAKEFLDKMLDSLRYVEDANDYIDNLKWKIEGLKQFEKQLEYHVDRDRIRYFVPYPELVLEKLLRNTTDKILLMSATSQSKEVLNQIYKINPQFIYAEQQFLGTLHLKVIGLEQTINYKTWNNQDTRQQYWQCLSKILEIAAKPCLVNVHSFNYLPLDRIGLIPSQGEAIKNQTSEETKFFNGSNEVLFTTRSDRGLDLADNKGRSIVMLKYPFPQRTDPCLVAMEKRLGKAYDAYYRDIAARGFVQSVARVLRSKDDFAEFYSPDLYCHTMLHRLWSGKIDMRNMHVNG